MKELLEKLMDKPLDECLEKFIKRNGLRNSKNIWSDFIRYFIEKLPVRWWDSLSKNRWIYTFLEIWGIFGNFAGIWRSFWRHPKGILNENIVTKFPRKFVQDSLNKLLKLLRNLRKFKAIASIYIWSHFRRKSWLN